MNIAKPLFKAFVATIAFIVLLFGAVLITGLIYSLFYANFGKDALPIMVSGVMFLFILFLFFNFFRGKN